MFSFKLVLVLALNFLSSVSPFDFDFPTVEDLLYGPVPFDDRIVGGKDANIEDHPYQVSFVVNNSYFCGGFIVSENYILTAAHCAQDVDPSTVVLRAGSTWRRNGTVIPIAEITPHPEYDSPRFDKDVAVIKTAEPIQFTDVIKPVKLPKKGRVLKDNSKIMVSGWGRTEQAATSIPERLMDVEIPVVPYWQCMTVYFTVMTRNMWCGGNFILGGQGTCQGDSGGAAVQDGKAVVSPLDFNFPTVGDLLYGPVPFDDRIVGGQEANIEDYPYQVSFIVNNSYFCGGFVVSENYILTAAHCAQNVDPSKVILRAGSSFRRNGTLIPIAEVTPHPEYDNPRFDKDVAVMKTVDPIEFTDVIQPVSLPPRGRPMEGNTMFVVSGWGRTKQGASTIPERLMDVEIPVVYYLQCYLVYPTILTRNMWCGGNFFLGGKGTCQGDSGGAAVQDGMAVASPFGFNLPSVGDLLYGPASFDDRIVGGEEADIEDYPHQVSFIVNNSYFCGGFVVSENYILTAAHCAQNVDPSTVVLRAGSSWRRNGTIIPIAEVIPHPEYDDPAFDKDVAVMRTVDPIEFSDVIQPVALPPKNRNLEGGSKVSVSGWGRTQQGASSIPERLMAVEIPVVDQTRCYLVYSSVLTDNQWCGGNFFFGGKGTCQGDSGGAATQDGMAVGIVSYGRGCAQPLSPSVFADIAAPTIRDFITEHTGL
ncbi:hypothetical protein PYW08_015156 [Mythimna loreyi]|uniref:Uncharacterized protein n=1 Tax=Mythimna loreyi TaxID=667449 RepID=A0ACC2QUV5_9NEOP|nr:hypothetical protein PYW08_015156 [Mythimna loreyi]